MKGRLSVWVMAGMAVVAALLAVSAVLLFLGIRRFNDAGKTVLGRFHKLESFYTRQPFPSPANVRQQESNAEQLGDWFERLHEELRKGDNTVVERSPTRFMTQLATVRNGLLATAQEHGVGVRTEFAFGFDRYLTDGGELPPPEIVPRLTHQLLAMDALSRVLIDQSVSSIDAVEREDLDAARRPGPARPEAPGGRPRPGRPAPGGQPAAPTPEAELFKKFTYTIDFRASERATMAVLNQLARCPAFTVVTSVQINRDASIVVEAPQPVEPAASDAAATGGERNPPPDRSARIVSGPALEQPLRVRVVVDVYRFSGEVSGESA